MKRALLSFSSPEPPLNLLLSRVISRNLGVAKLGNRGAEMEWWYVWVLWTSPEAQEHIWTHIKA